MSCRSATYTFGPGHFDSPDQPVPSKVFHGCGTACLRNTVAFGILKLDSSTTFHEYSHQLMDSQITVRTEVLDSWNRGTSGLRLIEAQRISTSRHRRSKFKQMHQKCGKILDTIFIIVSILIPPAVVLVTLPLEKATCIINYGSLLPHNQGDI
jgi:hypothetical protein